MIHKKPPRNSTVKIPRTQFPSIPHLSHAPASGRLRTQPQAFARMALIRP